MITRAQFNLAISRFQRRHGPRASFTMAKELYFDNYQTKTLVLLLTTWNFAHFRYAHKTFNIQRLERTLENLVPYFDQLIGVKFRTADFRRLCCPIAVIYNRLSRLKGVSHNGAPKLMHFIHPELFVMWDSYVGGDNRPYRSYLSVFHNHTNTIKK